MSQVAQDTKPTLVAAYVDRLTREQLVKRATMGDRTLSAELRRAIRAWLEHTDEQEATP